MLKSGCFGLLSGWFEGWFRFEKRRSREAEKQRNIKAEKQGKAEKQKQRSRDTGEKKNWKQ